MVEEEVDDLEKALEEILEEELAELGSLTIEEKPSEDMPE